MIKFSNPINTAKTHISNENEVEISIHLSHYYKKSLIYIRLVILIIYNLFCNSSFCQKSYAHYRTDDTSKFTDTNKIDIKIVTSNFRISQCFFNGIVSNCNNEPIGYTFWTLFQADSVIVKTGISDSNGRFNFVCEKGSYTLKIRKGDCQDFAVNVEMKDSVEYQTRITLYSKFDKTITQNIIYRKPKKQLTLKTKLNKGVSKKHPNCKCGE